MRVWACTLVRAGVYVRVEGVESGGRSFPHRPQNGAAVQGDRSTWREHSTLAGRWGRWGNRRLASGAEQKQRAKK
eukprot:6184355-Pleurochrysis_carterae.AAC.1